MKTQILMPRTREETRRFTVRTSFSNFLKLYSAAAKAKNGEVTALLLVKGAEMTLINNKGEDAVHLAVGDALQAVRAFKEGDMATLRKRFPVVAPFLGMRLFVMLIAQLMLNLSISYYITDSKARSSLVHSQSSHDKKKDILSPSFMDNATSTDSVRPRDLL